MAVLIDDLHCAGQVMPMVTHVLNSCEGGLPLSRRVLPGDNRVKGAATCVLLIGSRVLRFVIQVRAHGTAVMTCHAMIYGCFKSAWR